jgi:hypothetical protein
MAKSLYGILSMDPSYFNFPILSIHGEKGTGNFSPNLMLELLFTKTIVRNLIKNLANNSTTRPKLDNNLKQQCSNTPAFMNDRKEVNARKPTKGRN